ncbi:non-hydrolyzing UDP-N-acetylglucosamine 2-epimerase [Neobacillus sp. SM06]|uniref:non-hydrolyzing UDP-N-acetylglucosamine 2-epimerase n=1 Tax=Neobacillus sp. SM06 TaxID=3422492 RepID=UPI003D2C1463
MKILTVLGTRPEIIRLSLIIKKLDQYADQHVLVHTGQNFTATLSDIFFKELNIRNPDYHIHMEQLTLGAQLGTIYRELEKMIEHEKADKMLVLGDTNSALSALLAERIGIPVYHMEAGNRCFDLNVPEEKNRKVIDAVSTFNLPYTAKSKENLVKEGIPSKKIFVSGNPIYEVLTHFKNEIAASTILKDLQLSKQNYFLVTVHRAENVDFENSFKEILTGLNLVASHFGLRMICSVHPRTRSKLNYMAGISMHPLVEFHEPFGFFDFVKLQQNAFCVMTDSGTVQEESCIYHVPAVTLRNSTERPETVEVGSNIVSGVDAGSILRSVQVMTREPRQWPLPDGYQDLNVSAKVVKFILGGTGVV